MRDFSYLGHYSYGVLDGASVGWCYSLPYLWPGDDTPSGILVVNREDNG